MPTFPPRRISVFRLAFASLCGCFATSYASGVCWRSTVISPGVDGIVGFLNDGGVLISDTFSSEDCTGHENGEKAAELVCFHGNVLIVDEIPAMDAVMSRGARKIGSVADVKACEGPHTSTVVVSMEPLLHITGLRRSQDRIVAGDHLIHGTFTPAKCAQMRPKFADSSADVCLNGAAIKANGSKVSALVEEGAIVVRNADDCVAGARGNRKSLSRRKHSRRAADGLEGYSYGTDDDYDDDDGGDDDDDGQAYIE